MSDSFLLNEEWAEWIGQKKSELLAWLIQNQPSVEIPLEKFAYYEQYHSDLLGQFDERYEDVWDGKNIYFYFKFFNQGEPFWLFSVVVEIPYDDGPIYFPILTVPSHHPNWLYPLVNQKSKSKNKLN